MPRWHAGWSGLRLDCLALFSSMNRPAGTLSSPALTEQILPSLNGS